MVTCPTLSHTNVLLIPHFVSLHRVTLMHLITLIWSPGVRVIAQILHANEDTISIVLPFRHSLDAGLHPAVSDPFGFHFHTFMFSLTTRPPPFTVPPNETPSPIKPISNRSQTCSICCYCKGIQWGNCCGYASSGNDPTLVLMI